MAPNVGDAELPEGLKNVLLSNGFSQLDPLTIRYMELETKLRADVDRFFSEWIEKNIPFGDGALGFAVFLTVLVKFLHSGLPSYMSSYLDALETSTQAVDKVRELEKRLTREVDRADEALDNVTYADVVSTDEPYDQEQDV